MVDIDLRKLPKQQTKQASKFRRILAFILDLFIIDIFIISSFEPLIRNIMPQLSFETIKKILENPDSTSLANLSTITLFIGVLSILYFALTEYHAKQTLGMKILRLKVESQNKDEEIAFWKCLVRNLYALPIFPLILLWIIEPIYFMITGIRLTEIITKTRTVEELN